MKWTFKRTVATMLACTMMALGTGRAQAMLAPARMESEAALRTQDLQAIQVFLEQKQVQQHLSEMNLSATEINTRLGNLSDPEVHRIATRIDQENPGRDGGDAVVSILLIGILVLLFVYLLKRI